MDVLKILDNKYELIREIKRGGFGVVYYGRDRLFGKPVAIKAISPELLGEAKYIDIFQAESLSVARLNHHNIVRLYDIKRTEDGQFYIIMEYIDGVDLGKLISASRKEGIVLPFHIGAYVIAQTCAGLDYAHARRDPETHQPLNIVHQDISPSNIMLNRLGEVKIIDFGLANARRRSISQRGRRREILLQGKIAYLAPEQVNGTRGVDRRSDIFSLGLVMYEVLTGERLIKNDDPAKVIEILESGNWSFAALATKRVPEALQLIVRRAVQDDPEKRYQTANHMYFDLMKYLATHEAGKDLSNELSLLVQRLAPAPARREAEEESTESLRRKYRETSPENSKRHRAAPQTETVINTFDFVDSSTESEPPMAGKARDRADDQSHHHFGSNGSKERIPEAEPSLFEAPPSPESGGKAEPGTDKSDPSIQEVPYYRILEEEEDEEEQRTIIDVIRLSTRSHKKVILSTLGSLAVFFLLFTILDTTLRWTGYGSSIYDFLFPPAIRLVSFPPNAQVYLDDKLLPQTTPVAIEKISPGVHKLMLLLPRFEPIVRSIHVPPKGKVVVHGESSPSADQPYIFRFKTTLELSSKPPGAEVYLNGIKYTQLTPCRVVWEVGDPLQIEMEKPGFFRLTGFTLNTLEGVETVEDRRLWRFQRIEQEREHFVVEGTFAKTIVLASIPNNAEIYLDGSDRPVGVTGFTNRLLLTMGTHTVTLKKRDYLAKTFTLYIDEDSPAQYQEVLSRSVKISAKDAADPGGGDIAASILQLTHEGNAMRVRAITPCELTLLPYRYTALLRREGYKDFILSIPSAGRLAIAAMHRIDVPVEIIIVDDATDAPLENAQLSYRPLTQEGQEIIVKEGDSLKELPPGEYRLTVRMPGYQEVVRDFLVTANGRNQLIVRMLTQ